MKRAGLVAIAALVMGSGGCIKQQQDDGGQLAGGRAIGGGASGGSVTTEAGPEWVADWTMLVFAANDDRNQKLVAAFDQDLEELQHGLGGSSAFRILVQRDYAKHQLDGKNQPRPSELYGIYREQKFNPQTMKVENPLAGESGTIVMGETDTTNPNVLRDFLVYGVKRFPAKRYWVVITGHGDGWNGLAYDATTASGSRMSLAGLRQAFGDAAQVLRNEVRSQPALKNYSQSFDVVQFDACRMGSIEVAAALSDYVDYMVASEEVVPNAGHPYSALRYLAQNETGSHAQTVVRSVVTDYVRAYVEGISTVSRDYVGHTVSSVGLRMTAFEPLYDAIVRFKQAVLAERPQGFSCQEVAAIADKARERAQLVNPQEVHQDVNSDGRASEASSAAVDLIALFETFAGTDLLRQDAGCSGFNADPFGPLSVPLSEPVRQAAREVLRTIGRPHLFTKAEPCGVQLRYNDQFRRLWTFEPDCTGCGKIDSPFVVEAHKVDGGGKRATSISTLFGNAYDLLFIKDGTTALDTYSALPFEQRTGWTQVFGQCIDQARACRAWRPDSGQPNPCNALP